MSGFKRFFCSGVALLMMFIACSSDKESPVTPTTPPKAPEFTLKQFVFPAKMMQSADEKAKLALQIAAEVTNFEGTGCIFEPPAGATAVKEESGNWEYEWMDNNVKNVLKITAGGGRYTWQLLLSGNVEGVSLENWRKMDVVQRTDQTNGHVYLYKLGTQQITIEWVWYTLENGDYKFVKQWYEPPTGKIEFTFKADKSGRLERFSPNSKGSLVYDLRITWNSEGNGAWWTFNDGTQTGYGSWN